MQTGQEPEIRIWYFSEHVYHKPSRISNRTMAAFCVSPTFQAYCSNSKWLCSTSAYPRGRAESARRIFVGDSQLNRIGAAINLSKAEIAHLRAARARAGTPITLLNQSGDAAYGILDPDRTSVTVTSSISDTDVSTSLSVALCAPQSNSRADWAVEKAAEVGVSTMLFVTRSARIQREGVTENRLERWRRVAAAAAKQSLSTKVMSVKRYEGTFQDMFKDRTHGHSSVLLCSPRGTPMLSVLPKIDLTNPLLLIGPEGGLTDEEELELEKAGCVSVSLGSKRLRVETAVVCSTSSVASFQFAMKNFRQHT